MYSIVKLNKIIMIGEKNHMEKNGITLEEIKSVRANIVETSLSELKSVMERVEKEYQGEEKDLILSDFKRAESTKKAFITFTENEKKCS